MLPLLKEAMALRRSEKERDRYLTRTREIKGAIMGRMRKGQGSPDEGLPPRLAADSGKKIIHVSSRSENLA